MFQPKRELKSQKSNSLSNLLRGTDMDQIKDNTKQSKPHSKKSNFHFTNNPIQKFSMGQQQEDLINELWDTKEENTEQQTNYTEHAQEQQQTQLLNLQPIAKDIRDFQSYKNLKGQYKHQQQVRHLTAYAASARVSLDSSQHSSKKSTVIIPNQSIDFSSHNNFGIMKYKNSEDLLNQQKFNGEVETKIKQLFLQHQQENSNTANNQHQTFLTNQEEQQKIELLTMSQQIFSKNNNVFNVPASASQYLVSQNQLAAANNNGQNSNQKIFTQRSTYNKFSKFMQDKQQLDILFQQKNKNGDIHCNHYQNNNLQQ